MPRMSARARCRSALAVLSLAASPGCVHVYEPLSGLHRPVIVDPQAPNFRDLHLQVVCPPGDFVDRDEARDLCDHVGKLFENQGAIVTTTDRLGSPDVSVTPDDAPVGETAAAPRTDLVLELRARQLHYSNDPLSWVLCIATFTIVPAVTESTFAQDVTIRDGTGFLLVQDTMTGRIVRTVGVGTWFGNRVLDRLVRKKSDRLNSDAVHADLSTDLYGQLSQLVFNAKMRWEVLREATPDGRATSGAP